MPQTAPFAGMPTLKADLMAKIPMGRFGELEVLKHYLSNEVPRLLNRMSVRQCSSSPVRTLRTSPDKLFPLQLIAQ